MKKLPITVVIAVKNEEANLHKCLEALEPAERVVLIDSQSVDDSIEIGQAYGAEVYQFHYEGVYPKKRQWALENVDISSDWIFLLDADEVVPRSLWLEIENVTGDPESPDAFLITKGFHFLGRKLRHGGFSHSAVLLFRKGKAKFEELDSSVDTGLDMEVHERVVVDGRVGKLASVLVHEDFKGLKAYIGRHNQYSSWEAGVRYSILYNSNYGDKAIEPKLFGDTQQKRRYLKNIAVRLPFEPSLWFIYHYIFRMGFLEGRRGLIASQIRASYISQARSKLYELELARFPREER